MKKFLLASFLLTSAALLCSAQVLVHDGFETYPINKSFVGGPWTLYGYDLDTQAGGFIRGEYQGIKPYEGNQMYGIATPVEGEGSRSISDSRGLESSVLPPASEFSFAFYVGAENARCQRVFASPHTSGERAHSFEIDLHNGNWRLTGTDESPKFGTLPLAVGTWAVLVMRSDWVTNMHSVRLNGKNVVSARGRTATGDSRRYTGAIFGAQALAAAGAGYSYPIGGPPLFVDDYRLTNVPEPSSITIAFGLLAVGAIWRLRRTLNWIKDCGLSS